MKKTEKIIVSENSFNNEDPYMLVNSNITVVNLLREEGIEINNIHDDSMISYYIDYYNTQYENGNFSQFVWNSKWSSEINNRIISGLEKIGAEKQLQLFIEQSQKVEALPAEALKSFLHGEYFDENSVREMLKNKRFYEIDENIVALNSQWLRNHPDLLVLSIDDMFLELEKFLGRKVSRE